MTGSLPSSGLRRLLVDAVRDLLSDDGAAGDASFLREHVGAIASTILFGPPYSVQVGTIRSGGRSDSVAGRDPVAWFARQHPSGRVEVVDLAPRPHQTAKYFRCDYVWGWSDEHPRGSVFIPNGPLTLALHAARRPEFLDRCLELALKVGQLVKEPGCMSGRQR